MFLEIQTRLNGPNVADHVLINLKKQAISISINTFTVYTFDLNGRFITALIDGHTFRRGLDNRVMEKWSVASNGRKKHLSHWLNLKKKRAFLNQVHYQIWKLFCVIQQEQFEIIALDESSFEITRKHVLNALDKILFFDFYNLENDARAFSSIYHRVGILPPDMYLSLVLQATEGCSYNRCSFCNFYKGEQFRIKPDFEFLRHIQAVKHYFGEAIFLRKFIFLGEANALDIPQLRLLKFFDIINQQFSFADSENKSQFKSSLAIFSGIFSFMTAFHKVQKSADDFALLRTKNLRRVYIGLETGCDSLLKFLNKPGSAENAISLVSSIKKGGVNVGVVILLGAGGDRYYESHVSDTVQAIREMRLNKGDIIFFSPIIQHPESEYSKTLIAKQIRPVIGKDLDTQKQEMIAAFGFPKTMNAPKMALYNINEFIY